MRRRGLSTAMVATTMVVLGAAPGRASEVVDLATAPSWTVLGGSSMGPVGDVDGDGVADAAVSDCPSGDRAGEVRVVRGPLGAEKVAFEDAGDGFSIHGAQADDYACRLPMHPVGDVNGDGLSDIVVGASLYGRSGGAMAYVVFGKTDEHPVDLGDFDDGVQGARGYVIHGSGNGVDGIGDMNSDGLADIALGGRSRTYVVFGQSSTDPVELSTFVEETHGDRGFVISNRCRECFFGSVGDVNGDDVPDVAVGGVAWRRYEAPGTVHVVFGKSDGGPVDTRERSPGLLRIKGDEPAGMWDGGVSGAGDVNGDGLGDVVVGVPRTYSCCQGKAAVVFGKKDAGTVRLADLGDRGFQIFSDQERDFLGNAVLGVGDVNDDGLDDVAVAADGFDYGDRGGPGAVFVVYGERSASDVRTGSLGDRGYVIVGREDGDRTGTYLGAPGDVDGDGKPDLMISATTGGVGYLLFLR